MPAREAMDRERNSLKEDNGVCDGGSDLWCATYDSNPLEYAKEPSGNAESDIRRRECRA